ncbi:hypothetical protein IDH50_03185 [Aeromicrobium tamlense]|uniref:Uncharacterized protein n=1 Tax=Aeromicrobium tamlense TaxID=375541 RepID=A0A8I0KKS7_9ACTN|nr:hypothetical protein [Aeromicrobium tamlense]MBD1269228.1 hypothetical protein [Aeromicrobium tamlense]NYI36863.1 hypothetical protein [Aeromicrobium tamlense]
MALGIAILSDPSLGGEIPEVVPESRVSANDKGVVVLIRHAQDVETLNGDFAWAEASVIVRHWPSAPAIDPDRSVIFEGSISTPTRQLWIGDADHEVVMTGLTESSTLRVLSAKEDSPSADRVWVDVWDA